MKQTKKTIEIIKDEIVDNINSNLIIETLFESRNINIEDFENLTVKICTHCGETELEETEEETYCCYCDMPVDELHAEDENCPHCSEESWQSYNLDNNVYTCKHCNKVTEEPEEEDQTVYQWLFVSYWLYGLLQEAGAVVADTIYGYIFGRGSFNCSFDNDGDLQKAAEIFEKRNS